MEQKHTLWKRGTETRSHRREQKHTVMAQLGLVARTLCTRMVTATVWERQTVCRQAGEGGPHSVWTGAQQWWVWMWPCYCPVLGARGWTAAGGQAGWVRTHPPGWPGTPSPAFG